MLALPAELQQLADACRVQTSYEDVFGDRQTASVASLLAILKSLGYEVDELADVPSALQAVLESQRSEVIPPVTVVWDGRQGRVGIQWPGNVEQLECHLSDGQQQWQWKVDRDELQRRPEQPRRARRSPAIDAGQLKLPANLPLGYLQLRLDAEGKSNGSSAGTWHGMVISAPSQSYIPPGVHDPHWGVFLPLYALRSQHSWSAGNYGDLARLCRWVGRQGGSVIGTLPLLSGFYQPPVDPSPYAPASRLFWNEFFVDPEQLPAALVDRELFPTDQQRAQWRSEPLVDYGGEMRIKRAVLQTAANRFFDRRDEGFSRWQQHIESRPLVTDYAAFRAVAERLGTDWHVWPDALRDGDLTLQAADRAAEQFYLFAQWVAHEQLEQAATQARQHQAGLYLDLPLGVRSDGFDVWRFPHAFARGATAGAPPDTVFTGGQGWGFLPLHPEQLRLDGYRHFRDVLTHHMQMADQLRIDHVMGLHRLYWIPQGMSPREGVYVRYHAEELYAIINLESHRHRTRVVGENLGTVPREVNRQMSQRRIGRMYVVQYELSPTTGTIAPPSGTVASINTHDMPSFTGWWQGSDLEDRRGMGLMNDSQYQDELETRELVQRQLVDHLQRQGWLTAAQASQATQYGVGFDAANGGSLPPDPQRSAADDPSSTAAVQVARGMLQAMAASPADLLLVNLEDLWAERLPQNVPGTGPERDNWRRKARYSLEEFGKLAQVTEVLHSIDRQRKQAASASATKLTEEAS